MDIFNPCCSVYIKLYNSIALFLVNHWPYVWCTMIEFSHKPISKIQPVVTKNKNKNEAKKRKNRNETHIWWGHVWQMKIYLEVSWNSLLLCGSCFFCCTVQATDEEPVPLCPLLWPIARQVRLCYYTRNSVLNKVYPTTSPFSTIVWRYIFLVSYL